MDENSGNRVSPSPAKLAANRRNARRSTGPRTLAGKRRSALNSRRHAILSATPVLPGVELEADWEAHRAGTIASLAPVGYLENLLVERAATLLWRMGRVTRYETANTVSRLEMAEVDLAKANSLRVSPLVRTEAMDRAELEQSRRARVLLRGKDLDKVVRYETHLERSLGRTLQELRQLQEVRAAVATPTPPPVESDAAAEG